MKRVIRFSAGLFFASLVFVNQSYPCSGKLPRIRWDYEVSTEKGEEYRRVDVQIIKVERYENIQPDSSLSFKAEINPQGFVKIELHNRSNRIVKDIIITQTLEGSVDGLVKAKRILSKSPLVAEDFITAPYHMENNRLYIGIARMMPGEVLQLGYRLQASFINRPILLSPVVKRERVEEKVIRNYTFYFKPGQSEVDIRSLEKLLMEVRLLPEEEEHIIRVKGYADASGPYRISSNLAKKRAEKLVNQMLIESVACIESYFYAEGLTGTPIEAK
ncbi:MAG: hypothetical protein ABDH29_06545 [Aquificaceae bacterium]